MTTDNYPHAAAGFLYDPKKQSVLLHHRDGFTKHDPFRWAFFTGLCHEGETPLEGFCREIKEEINLTLNPNEVIPLCEYLNEELLTYRHVFYVESAVPLADLKLGEGAGFNWVPLAQVFALDLTEKTNRDLKYFLSTIKK